MSIEIAFDHMGNTIHAMNATPSACYKCCYCNVDMHVTRQFDPTTGRIVGAYYSCYPGKEHTEDICRVLSSQNRRSRSMTEFDPDEFFARIFEPAAPSHPGTSPLPGPIGVPAPGPTVAPPPFAMGIAPVTTPKFTSLSQMWKDGLHLLHPATMLGERRLSNTLISNKSFGTIRNNMINGPRIIQARADGFYPADQCLWFICMDKNGDVWERKTLLLLFEDEDNFKGVVRQLFRYAECENEAMRWKPIHKWVLVAGKWYDRSSRECRSFCYKKSGCRNCLGLMACEYTSARQIYASDEAANLFK